MSFFDNARKAVNRVGAEAERQAAIAKLSLELTSTKGKVKDKLEEMGKSALDLYRQGLIDHGSLESIVVEIDKLESHIKEVEGQIAAQKSAT